MSARNMDHVYETDISDYLDLIAIVIYAFGSLIFLGGLWIDWRNPGQVIISQLVIVDNPHPNSGLFIAALLMVLLGFVVSRIAAVIESYRMPDGDELEEETQEWVVDIGQND